MPNETRDKSDKRADCPDFEGNDFYVLVAWLRKETPNTASTRSASHEARC
jgi:hypothetical protein